MNQQTTIPILYHAHDPMCSWCWGFASVWEKLHSALQQQYGDKLIIHYLLGGLAPDSDQPMPQNMQHYLQQTWATIQQRIPGTTFNFDFWSQCQPRRSTWPSCRAVIAARQQGDGYHELMTRGIQQAYYLNARNPSDSETLVAVAGEIGLDQDKFRQDLESEETREMHQQEMQMTQQLGISGFPGLMLVANGIAHSVNVDYEGFAMMKEKVDVLMRGQ